jgi:hypothetical protein
MPPSLLSLVYDTKGRFVVHRISREEATYKLCKVGGPYGRRRGSRAHAAVPLRPRRREGAQAVARQRVWAEQVQSPGFWRSPDCWPPSPFRAPQVRRMQFGKGAIPYIGTHDGRTIRYPDPDVKARGLAGAWGVGGVLGGQQARPSLPRCPTHALPQHNHEPSRSQPRPAR